MLNSIPEPATPLSLPTDTLIPTGFRRMRPLTGRGRACPSGCGFEVAWDGERALLALDDHGLRFLNEDGINLNPYFPEFRGLSQSVDPDWTLIQGEMIVLWKGQLQREKLIRRLNATRVSDAAGLAHLYPATFVAYDILRIGNAWMTDVHWEERRRTLSRVLRPDPRLRLSPVYTDAETAIRAAEMLGGTGYTVRRLRGCYEPAATGIDWLRTEIMPQATFVVVGYLPTDPATQEFSGVRALLLAREESGALRYMGSTAGTLQPQHCEFIRQSETRQFVPNLVRDGDFPCQARPVGAGISADVRHKGYSAVGKVKWPMVLKLSPSPEPTKADATAFQDSRR